MLLLEQPKPEIKEVPKPKVEDHLGLAHAIASQFVRPRERVKDSEFYTIACMGLMEAANTYTPEKGKFGAYAWGIMRNAILDELKKWKRSKRRVVFEALSKKAMENIPQRKKSWTPPAEQFLEILLADDTDKEIRDMVIAIYLEGMKIKEVAEQLGMTRMGVYKRIRQYFKKLRLRHGDLLDVYEEAVEAHE